MPSRAATALAAIVLAGCCTTEQMRPCLAWGKDWRQVGALDKHIEGFAEPIEVGGRVETYYHCVGPGFDPEDPEQMSAFWRETKREILVIGRGPRLHTEAVDYALEVTRQGGKVMSVRKVYYVP